MTVAIDTELTEALIEEGFVRELVSKFQTMRKEAGFHVEDHIRAYASGNRKIEALLAANSAQVGSDILADAVCTGSLARLHQGVGRQRRISHTRRGAHLILKENTPGKGYSARCAL